MRAMHLSWPRRSCAVALACAIALAVPLPAAADGFAGQARAQVGAVVDKFWSGAQDLAVYALGLIGVEYRYGGDEPSSGLDCSGLVRHVFQEVTGVTLPRTSQALSQLGNRVGRHELAPGDLVFFNTRRFAFSHVGIYLGEGRFIHAPRTGRDVEIAQFDSRYWQKRYDGARRLVGVLPALMPTLVASAHAAPPAGPEALPAEPFTP